MSARLTKSDLFVELNDTKRQLMLAERKLAAVSKVADEVRCKGVHGWCGVTHEAAQELRNILNGTCDS